MAWWWGITIANHAPPDSKKPGARERTHGRTKRALLVGTMQCAVDGPAEHIEMCLTHSQAWVTLQCTPWAYKAAGILAFYSTDATDATDPGDLCALELGQKTYKTTKIKYYYQCIAWEQVEPIPNQH